MHDAGNMSRFGAHRATAKLNKKSKYQAQTLTVDCQMQFGKIAKGIDRYFLILCIMGAFAILSSTMSKDPVLNPFAISLGTPADLTGVIAAASTIPGILVVCRQRHYQMFMAEEKFSYFQHSFSLPHPSCTCW